jgi:hypothetical protein
MTKNVLNKLGFLGAVFVAAWDPIPPDVLIWNIGFDELR